MVARARGGKAILTVYAVLALPIPAAGQSDMRGGSATEAETGFAPNDWPSFGRTGSEQHYSPLDIVNDRNVGKLGLAWSQDLPDGNAVTAPVAAGGRVFTATGHSLVSAFDAITGKLVWRYDTHASEKSGYKLRQGYGSRGLAYADGRIFVGTHDGRLISIDAQTGRPVWSVLTTQPGDLRFITGAPRVFAGKVIIGHGGADGSRARGYVTCYDAKDGRQLWRFYTVPGNPADGFEDAAQAMAAKTWHGQWWKDGAGGVAWNAFSYDTELNRFYIGTGNGFAFNQTIRSEGRGDNLFLSSIVALDADSGRYVWHYQVNPGEQWDYDAAMDMTLATLTIDGKPRKVLMQAPKNGFFYLIDRTDGKLISAQPFAKVTWASRIDVATGRPVENPGARYHGREPFEMWPSMTGAHSWLPQSYSPKTGLVYLPVIERGMIIGDRGIDPKTWTPPVNLLGGLGIMGDFAPDLPGSRRSFLKAWDPIAQKARWTVETPGDWPGGTMATAGNLVFQGQADHKFNAYAADSGKLLWSFDARAPVVAPPISYGVNAHQYVTVLTGSGASGGGFYSAGSSQFGINYRTMPRRVLTFALGGTATLPAPPPSPKLLPPPEPQPRPAQSLAERGNLMFHMACAACHGAGGVVAGTAPDLRSSTIPPQQAAFDAVVRGGALVSKGMPQFADLPVADVEAIRQYLRTLAQALPKQSAPLQR
jgi:quinohemoprotein ethanol dehydrogenase